MRSSSDQERQQPALPAHRGVQVWSNTRQVGVGAQLRLPGPQQPALSAHRATCMGGQHGWVRSSDDLDLRSPHYLRTEQLVWEAPASLGAHLWPPGAPAGRIICAPGSPGVEHHPGKCAWVGRSGDQERQQPAISAHQGVRPRSTTQASARGCAGPVTKNASNPHYLRTRVSDRGAPPNQVGVGARPVG